jgi:glutamine phosphoribosylpyrophosphate amidotransferase
LVVLTENLKGKKVVLIDDSIVRGVTMAPIVKLLRAEGAAEVTLNTKRLYFFIFKKKMTQFFFMLL